MAALKENEPLDTETETVQYWIKTEVVQTSKVVDIRFKKTSNSLFQTFKIIKCEVKKLNCQPTVMSIPNWQLRFTTLEFSYCLRKTDASQIRVVSF